MADPQAPVDDPPGACPGQDDLAPAAEPALAAAGWTARFLTDDRRAEEVRQIYADLGFEVMTRPLAPDHVGPLCVACVESTCPLYTMIYTRRRSVERDGTDLGHHG